MDNKKKYEKIFIKALSVDKSKFTEKIEYNEIPEWDSIGHLTILSSLDKATKGKSAEIKGLGNQKSLKKIWEILKKRGLAK